MLKGEGPSARKEIFYITDDGDLSAFRINKWKILFTQQKSIGLDVWREPFSPTRMPLLVDLHADPFERAMQPGPPIGRSASYEYDKWATQRMYAFVPAQAHRGEVLGSPSRTSAIDRSRAVSVCPWRRPRN